MTGRRIANVALSIRQPWAWAILHAGKDVENRDWSDRYPGFTAALRLVEAVIEEGGGKFLIHASLGMTRGEYEDSLADMHEISCTRPFPPGLALPAFESLPRGGIVGRAQLYDVVSEHASPWFFGPVGLVLRNVRPLPFVPCKGALGFFRVPDEVIGQLETKISP
jgi:hypothetical protein